MALWLAPKKAADKIRELNPGTQISERSIRRFVEEGFDCVKNGTRVLINVDDFDLNLKKFAEKQISK